MKQRLDAVMSQLGERTDKSLSYAEYSEPSSSSGVAAAKARQQSGSILSTTTLAVGLTFGSSDSTVLRKVTMAWGVLGSRLISWAGSNHFSSSAVANRGVPDNSS